MTGYERLKALIASPSDGCIIWPGHSVGGYGRIKIAGRPRRAHRVAWECLKGAIPDGLLVCHKCDVPLCVNPAHMFLGTAADNLADMYAKGRQITPGPKVPRKGEGCAAAVLTAPQVDLIRGDGRSQREIARAYGISKSQVGRIKRGEHWRHLQGVPA